MNSPTNQNEIPLVLTHSRLEGLHAPRHPDCVLLGMCGGTAVLTGALDELGLHVPLGA